MTTKKQSATDDQQPGQPGLRNADELAAKMAALTADRPMLGSLVIWEIPSMTIPVAQVQEMLESTGLTSIYPLELPPVRINAAISRTLAELARTGLLRRVEATGTDPEMPTEESASAIIERAPRVAKSTDNTDRAVYVLQRGFADTKADDVAWQTDTKIVYYKKPEDDQEALRFIGPLADEARALVERYRASYVARDLTEHVFKPLVQWEMGYSVRSRGGVYYVPAIGMETVRRMRLFVEELARYTGMQRDCTIRTFPMLDDKGARADLAESAYNALEAQVRDLAINLRDWLRDASKPEKARRLREKTLADFRASVAEVVAKVQFYGQVTGMPATQLQRACDELLSGLELLSATEAESGASEREERTSLVADLASIGLRSLDMTREERESALATDATGLGGLDREERDF